MCGLSGVKGSLRTYLRSDGPELDVEDGMAVKRLAHVVDQTVLQILQTYVLHHQYHHY